MNRKMLLMNTCGAEGVVALAEGGSVVALETLPGRGSSESLMPGVRRLFDGKGRALSDLGAVVVVVGPGSFTGVRVGLSAAKGLCEAGGVGMVAISRLAAVAASLALGDEPVTTVALLDAGRGEFYCGVYRAGECLGESLAGRERVSALAGASVLVTCEARVQNALEGLDVALVDEPGPETLRKMASMRIADGDWSDVATTDANYLRRTDAELVVERRSAGGVR